MALAQILLFETIAHGEVAWRIFELGEMRPVDINNRGTALVAIPKAGMVGVEHSAYFKDGTTIPLPDIIAPEGTTNIVQTPYLIDDRDRVVVNAKYYPSLRFYSSVVYANATYYPQYIHWRCGGGLCESEPETFTPFGDVLFWLWTDGIGTKVESQTVVISYPDGSVGPGEWHMPATPFWILGMNSPRIGVGVLTSYHFGCECIYEERAAWVDLNNSNISRVIDTRTYLPPAWGPGPGHVQASEPLRINDQNSVAGWWSVPVTRDSKVIAERHAVIWLTATTSPVPIDVGQTGQISATIDLNERSDVLFWEGVDATNSVPMAYIEGKRYALNESLVNGAGWKLESAVAMNSLRQIIGVGLKDGRRVAYRLDPVETATELDAERYTGVTVIGRIGDRYRIDFVQKMGMTNWVGVGELTLTNWSQIWYDAASAKQPQGYYRAVKLP